MKKILITIGVAVILISTQSCKKSYTCQCTLNNGSTEKLSIKADNETAAEELCINKEDESPNRSTCYLL